MLRITTDTSAGNYFLKLEGCLVGAWVPELATCWHQVSGSAQDGRVCVDLTDVCHVDDAGRALITLMYRAGVRFIASGFVMPELVREISETVSREVLETADREVPETADALRRS